MDDLLKQYIIPERIENSPEGFTSKVMTRIQYDKISETSRTVSLVPVISALITVLFVIIALLLPESQTTQPVIIFLKNLVSSSQITNLSSVFRLTLPSVILYVIVGIFILTLFDRALHGIFKKEK